jgi:hypothetical protein
MWRRVRELFETRTKTRCSGLRLIRHYEEPLRRSNAVLIRYRCWIASRNLSSGARSRDSVDRNDVEALAERREFVVAEAIQYFALDSRARFVTT